MSEIDFMQFAKPGDPVPPNLGMCADMYKTIRDARLDKQHEVEDLEKREKEIKAHIIANLKAQELNGVAGTEVRVQIKPKKRPWLIDWEQFAAYVIRTGKTNLLYKRVSSKAVEEMSDEGEPLPDGVEMENYDDLTVNKV